MNIKEKEYKELFLNLKKYSNDENKYFEELIKLTMTILYDRTSFVKNSDNDSKRAEFFKMAKEKIRSTYEEEKTKDKSLSLETDAISFIGNGHTSLAFKIGDKVIKIGKRKYGPDKLLDKVSSFPFIVPIYYKKSIEVGNSEHYTIEITQLADTRDLTEEDLYATYKKLRQKGYIWNDPRLDNIGRIKVVTNNNENQIIEERIVIFDLEDFAYVGEETTDEVLDEIAISSYNPKTYTYETRYIKEQEKAKKLIK